MQRICQSGHVPYSTGGNLILVNASCPLEEQLRKECLIAVTANREKNGGVRLALQAGKVLLHILTDIDYKGQIIPVSGYRDREEQTELYEHSLYEDGRSVTEKYVAAPDCSEHQTGFPIQRRVSDISGKSPGIRIRGKIPEGKGADHRYRMGTLAAFPVKKISADADGD